MKTITTRQPFAIRHLLIAITGLALTALAAPVSAGATAHLAWADELITHLQPENNEYASNPSYINWAGVDSATTYENRTQCSTFLTNLLKRAYGWDNAYFKSWFGSTSPSAAQYHDQIQASKGFSAITGVQNIEEGDVIAIKYPSGLSSTGHVMIVKTIPQEITALAPIIENTRQFTVEIYDSSQSGHGAYDTRKLLDGSWDSGAGVGTFRLYANELTGEIVGYTWSTYSNSVYYPQTERHLVIGRLD